MLPKSALIDPLVDPLENSPPASAQTDALQNTWYMPPVMRLPPRSLTTFVLVVIGHLAVPVFLYAASSPAVSVFIPSTITLVGIIRPLPPVQNISSATTPPKPVTTAPRQKPTLQQSRLQPATATSATENLSTAPTAEVAESAELPITPASEPLMTSAEVSLTEPRFDADYLDNPAPVYPPLSRRAGETGKVILRVFVESSGLPGQIEVRTSSGFERLDKSAVAAVGRWKFTPARRGGDATGAWVLVPVDFNLKIKS